MQNDMLLTVEPAVFLDRDNTLIANDGDLGDPKKVRLLRGVASGLKALRQAGYRLVVVTNQGGVARGRFTENDVDAVNQKIAKMVNSAAKQRGLIDRFYYCPYHPQGDVPEYKREHDWRKPQPGMLLQAARDLGIDLSRSWMVGDSPRDVEAGTAAGCRTVLITKENEKRTASSPTKSTETFAEAIQFILRSSEPRKPVAAAPAAKETPPATKAPAPKKGNEPIDHLVTGPDSSPPTRPLAPAAPAAPTAPPSAPAKSDGDLASLRRSLNELAEEMRAQRTRQAEFSGFQIAAGALQLLAITFALLGLLSLGAVGDTFFRWMIGAVLVQLLTLTLLIVDRRS